MGAVIVNPRRAPRAPVRCQAQLAVGGGALFASSTSDYGPRGCQLLAPSPLPAGIRVHLQLADERVQRPVDLEGRVAWVANVPPWRMGVAFEVESLSAANGFFDALTAAYPRLVAQAHAPDRLEDDTPLAPAPPPEAPPALTADQADVLRALGAGMAAGALRERLGARFEGARSALFALLTRHYLVIGRPNPQAALEWSVIVYLGSN